MKELITKIDNGYIFSSTSARESKLYYGFELEFDGSYNRTSENAYAVAREIKSILENVDINSNVVSDGSLDSGLEVVLHPCTYSVIEDRSHAFTKIFRILQSNGYMNDNQKAGGHIHISRRTMGKSKVAQHINTAKIIEFFENHRLGIKKYSRRSSEDFNTWSKILDNYDYPTEQDMQSRYPNRRYQAINLCNKHTLEFRFFNAPTSQLEFLANLQLVKILVKTATSRHKHLTDYTTLGDLIEDNAKTNKELANYWRSL